jgi:hypothetical protein
MDVGERWVDERKVSEITERSVFTLRNERVQRKGFPFYRIGRSIRYKLSDILLFMEGRRIETRDQPKEG